MSLELTQPQGDERLEQHRLDAWTFGRIAITVNDSNAAPETTDDTPPDAIHIRIRSTGQIVIYNTVTGKWSSPQLQTLALASNITVDTPDGIYQVNVDDSENGDGLQSLVWMRTESGQKIGSYIVTQDFFTATI